MRRDLHSQSHSDNISPLMFTVLVTTYTDPDHQTQYLHGILRYRQESAQDDGYIPIPGVGHRIVQASPEVTPGRMLDNHAAGPCGGGDESGSQGGSEANGATASPWAWSTLEVRAGYGRSYMLCYVISRCERQPTHGGSARCSMPNALVHLRLRRL